jgi:hypothetical protein
MTIAIIVRRGKGSHPGDDIIDPLITALPVALQRGRNEMDERASGLQDVELEIPFRPNLRNGQVVQVVDLLFGVTWYGKITGLTHRGELASMVTSMKLKRPTDFVV